MLHFVLGQHHDVAAVFPENGFDSPMPAICSGLHKVHASGLERLVGLPTIVGFPGTGAKLARFHELGQLIDVFLSKRATLNDLRLSKPTAAQISVMLRSEFRNS